MTDDRGLIPKLLALAATDSVFVGPARVISSKGGAAPLATVLAQIDTAVLGRTLLFDIGGVTIRIAVAGRRMRALLSVSPEKPDTRTLTNKILSQDDPDTIRAVGRFFAGVCAGAPQITVISQPATLLGKPSETGVAATTLAQFWQIDGTTQPIALPETPMARFLAENKASLTAYLHAADDKIIFRDGNTAALDVIWQTQLTAFRTRQQAIYPDDNRPLLVCLDDALGKGRPAAVAVTGQEAGIFAYRPDRISQILASWRTITA